LCDIEYPKTNQPRNMMPRNQDVDRGGAEAPSNPNRQEDRDCNHTDTQQSWQAGRRRKAKKPRSQENAMNVPTRAGTMKDREYGSSHQQSLFNSNRATTTSRRPTTGHAVISRGKDSGSCAEQPLQPRRKSRNAIKSKRKIRSPRAIASTANQTSAGTLSSDSEFYGEPEKGKDYFPELETFNNDHARSSLTSSPEAEAPSFRTDRRESVRASVPGAVSVGGSGAYSAALLDDQPTANEMHAESRIGSSTSISIVTARVVDEENLEPMFPFVEAKPMRLSSRQETTQNVFKNRKVQISLALTTLLAVGLVVCAIVVLTSGGSKTGTTPATDFNDLVIAEFIIALHPFLSEDSLKALHLANTPQSQSLKWLSQQPNFKEWSVDRKIQRYAMGACYFATAGPSWAADANWMTDDDECKWTQDHVGEVCEDGVLRTLKINNNNLQGVLPDDLSLLSSLTMLDLGQNRLTGTVPDFVGKFGELEVLNLRDNHFSGIIPEALTQLSLLTDLNLSNNVFTGEIPTKVEDLQRLMQLDLSQNFLIGTIPSIVGTLKNLQSLRLSVNELTGGLPTTLGELSSLSVLEAHSNFLEGLLPRQLGKLKQITELILFNNTFSTIPSDIGLMRNLEYLDLDWNDIGGTIPSEIGQCTNLKELFLSGNQLTGTVPASLGLLKDLKLLLLSANSLRGTIPSSVCRLTTEQSLDPQDLQIDCELIVCTCCSDDEGDLCDFPSSDTFSTEDD
jgi:Leucine-rich repeat (LRR) protein